MKIDHRCFHVFRLYSDFDEKFSKDLFYLNIFSISIVFLNKVVVRWRRNVLKETTVFM